ncbi:hypothetical protein SDRG_06543 [Saprolegnia diclina VS20]|uniref:Uncharacterized protein n=1 Tax=Saprolegnia diclina (strain VS20) TaxID=1156394 RepID=T0QD11_SAPDV|nr:hypothetical protein SDRG_06543 [Saprolegnia diclina VS20]EQC35784.1 hypothetical protein SDRG_06543 [Saprolegnia diclina VS20]|eukprot:XP_008610546.1 hypothetical protein SDRG_06543 [Saprolegnia diclina VS20]
MADRATSQARQQPDSSAAAQQHQPHAASPPAQDASTTTLRRAGRETDDSDDEDGDDNPRPTKRCLRSDGPAEESLPLRPQRLTLQRRGQATDEERQAAAELRAQKALNSTIRKKIRCLERRQVLQTPSAERPAMRDYHMTW